MSALAAFRKNWVKADVFPLVAVVGVASSVGVYIGTRTLFKHNELNINKSQPNQYLTKNFREQLSPALCTVRPIDPPTQGYRAYDPFEKTNY